MREIDAKASVFADFLNAFCSDDPDSTGEVVALTLLQLSLARTITNPFRGVDILVNPPDTSRTIPRGRLDRVFGMRSGRPTIEVRLFTVVDPGALAPPVSPRGVPP